MSTGWEMQNEMNISWNITFTSVPSPLMCRRRRNVHWWEGGVPLTSLPPPNVQFTACQNLSIDVFQKKCQRIGRYFDNKLTLGLDSFHKNETVLLIHFRNLKESSSSFLIAHFSTQWWNFWRLGQSSGGLPRGGN